MTELAYLAAVVLALTFAWAGAAKLRAPRSTEATFRGLGLPAAGRLARVVPVVELLLAAGLLVVPGWAAAAALALLAGFTTILARAVRAGTGVSCGCFGSARQAPASAVDLLRNALLAAAALVATAASGPTLPGVAALVAAGAAVAIGAMVLALAELGHITGRIWAMELPRT